MVSPGWTRCGAAAPAFGQAMSAVATATTARDVPRPVFRTALLRRGLLPTLRAFAARRPCSYGPGAGAMTLPALRGCAEPPTVATARRSRGAGGGRGLSG